MISLNIEKTFGFISKESVSAYEAQTGLGSVDESCDVIRHVRRNRGGTAVFKRG